jgi:hypothetical protein
MGMNVNPQDLQGKLVHHKIFHRLSDDSDVLNPRAASIEERFVLKPNVNTGRLELYGTRVLIVRNVKAEEVLRFRVHESPRIQLQPSTLATVLYLACEDPNFLFQERVLELNCELGLAGLLGALCVGILNNPKAAAPRSPSPAMIDILPDKNKWVAPFPTKLQSLTLSDDDPEALNLAAMHAQQVDAHNIYIQELDWRHHPRLQPGKNLYRGILGSDLSYSFPNAKELARTVAYALEPQIGRFVHTCPSAQDDVVHLRHYLEQGYLMRVDARYMTLESHMYVPQILADGVMPTSFASLEQGPAVREETMEVVTATHHPEYDGLNGEYFFPIETGQFDKFKPNVYLEKERENPWGKL